MEDTNKQTFHPLILRFHRFLDAFSKSDEERDFFLDRLEGYLLYVNLEKSEEELQSFDHCMKENSNRFCMIPKLTFYETKKLMESFVNEKVYDIDTKEKLLDIISQKEARENFLEYIYDHLTELDKWQTFYHERSKIRVIEFLRQKEIRFVFEEDLELPKPTVEKLKESLFEKKVPKDIQSARNVIEAKADSYYTKEATNPRPKRGRPPKQTASVDAEPQLTDDIYHTIPKEMRPFHFSPDYSPNAVSFSTRFESDEHLLASMKGERKVKVDSKLEVLSQRLESLRHISSKLQDVEVPTSSGDKQIQAALEGVKVESKGSKLSGLFSGAVKKKTAKKKVQKVDSAKTKRTRKSVTQIKYKKS